MLLRVVLGVAMDYHCRIRLVQANVFDVFVVIVIRIHIVVPDAHHELIDLHVELFSYSLSKMSNRLEIANKHCLLAFVSTVIHSHFQRSQVCEMRRFKLWFEWSFTFEAIQEFR